MSLTAAKALSCPAVQLFMDRAAAGGYRYDLTDEAAPIVADICHQLGGMPLAIELIASRANTYGISGLARFGLQLSLAISSHYTGDSTEAGTALERGLSIAGSLRNTEYQLELLAGLNLHRYRLSDFGGALAAAESYAALAGKHGGPREAVTAEWMLATSHHLVRNQGSAQHSYESGFRRAATAGISEMHSFGYDHRVGASIGTREHYGSVASQ